MGNVKYVKCVGRPPTKVLETGEMLNMLNVLNVQGKIQPKWPKTCNIFNISPVLCTLGKTLNMSPVSQTYVHETGEIRQKKA